MNLIKKVKQTQNHTILNMNLLNLSILTMMKFRLRNYLQANINLNFVLLRFKFNINTVTLPRRITF